MGLHAVPPGGKESVIGRDLDAVRDGKTYCARKDDGAFFNMKLPLEDAAGLTIGILVMEIPFTSAADEARRYEKRKASATSWRS